MSLTFEIRNWLNIAESNESLMLKYADTGELKFIKALLKRLEKDVYHYVLSQVGPDLSPDICQITWEKVITKRRSYAETSTVKNWIFRIARTTMIDELRRQKRWQFDEFDENAVSQVMEHIAINQLVEEEQNTAFEMALYQLPFLQREAFILQQEGFRLREISQITQTDMEAVKSRLRYAKQSLMLALRQHEGEQ